MGIWNDEIHEIWTISNCGHINTRHDGKPLYIVYHDLDLSHGLDDIYKGSITDK